jgi:hypothetical protein
MTEITHRNIAGRMVQIVSAARLRTILDEQGEDYTRPSDFGLEDEWNTEGACDDEQNRDADYPRNC